MGRWIKKRQIQDVACFALVVSSMSCVRPSPSQVEPLSEYRIAVVASLLEDGGYGGSEKYLEPRHYFGEENDVVANEVVCRSDRALVGSVVNAFVANGYARDYDRYGVRNCATLTRASPDEGGLVSTLRVCVHSRPLLALCDITFLAIGSQYTTAGGIDVEVEQGRDEFMDEAIRTIEGLAAQLSAKDS